MSDETLVEEALVAALIAALPDVTPYPGLVPEGDPLPFIVYRQTDSSSNEGFSVITHSAMFEIDSAKVKGLDPDSYQQTKIMARQIYEALHAGFEHGGVCVYGVTRDKVQDHIDNTDKLYWCRSNFTFTYDTPIQ